MHTQLSSYHPNWLISFNMKRYNLNDFSWNNFWCVAKTLCLFIYVLSTCKKWCNIFYLILYKWQCKFWCYCCCYIHSREIKYIKFLSNCMYVNYSDYSYRKVHWITRVHAHRLNCFCGWMVKYSLLDSIKVVTEYFSNYLHNILIYKLSS